MLPSLFLIKYPKRFDYTYPRENHGTFPVLEENYAYKYPDSGLIQPCLEGFSRFYFLNQVFDGDGGHG